MKLRIVGVQHLSGVSKKTGKPYDFGVLHCLSVQPEHYADDDKCMIGYRAETMMVSPDMIAIPVPSLCDVFCDRFGRVEDIHVLEVFDAI